jgi:hypothetical protein
MSEALLPLLLIIAVVFSIGSQAVATASVNSRIYPACAPAGYGIESSEDGLWRYREPWILRSGRRSTYDSKPFATKAECIAWAWVMRDYERNKRGAAAEPVHIWHPESPCVE